MNKILLLLILGSLFGCSQSMRREYPVQPPAKKVDNTVVSSNPVAAVVPKLPSKKPSTDKVTIVLDAGHGGEDFGTHSAGKPQYQEKYLNLSTTLLVRNYLQQFGYQVLLTRNIDTFVSLEDRSLFANKQNPRLFVSIHYNSAPSTDAEGVEVFYYKDDSNANRVAKSKVLAQCIHNKVISNTKAKSRGVKHGNYSVIRETTMPAVLIEGGFLTNADEVLKIKDAAYMKSLALGIAQGIKDYLGKDMIMIK